MRLLSQVHILVFSTGFQLVTFRFAAVARGLFCQLLPFMIILNSSFKSTNLGKTFNIGGIKSDEIHIC